MAMIQHLEYHNLIFDVLASLGVIELKFLVGLNRVFLTRFFISCQFNNSIGSLSELLFHIELVIGALPIFAIVHGNRLPEIVGGQTHVVACCYFWFITLCLWANKLKSWFLIVGGKYIGYFAKKFTKTGSCFVTLGSYGFKAKPVPDNSWAAPPLSRLVIALVVFRLLFPPFYDTENVIQFYPDCSTACCKSQTTFLEHLG